MFGPRNKYRIPSDVLRDIKNRQTNAIPFTRKPIPKRVVPDIVARSRAIRVSHKKVEEKKRSVYKETSGINPATYIRPIENIFENFSSTSSLPFVRNPYPAEVGTSPANSYSGKDSITGKFDENVYTLPFRKLNLGSIEGTGVKGCGSISFIVQFADTNRLYTGSRYYSKLSAESNNPYINLDTVSIVTLPGGSTEFKNYTKKFQGAENFSETTVTQRLASGDVDAEVEIIRYINWMVSGLGPQEITKLGSSTFSSDGDPDSPTFLGFDHEAEINAEASAGGAFTPASSPIPVNIGGGTRPVPVKTKDPDKEPTDATPPTVDNLFPPFGVAGRKAGEIRIYEGIEYVWQPGRRALFAKRGRDNGTWMVLTKEKVKTESTPIPPPIMPRKRKIKPPIGPIVVRTRGGGSRGGGSSGGNMQRFDEIENSAKNFRSRGGTSGGRDIVQRRPNSRREL